MIKDGREARTPPLPGCYRIFPPYSDSTVIPLDTASLLLKNSRTT